MFIVYSPEGQSSIAASSLMPQLKVDPSTKVLSVGESQMDDLLPDLEQRQSKGKGSQGALKQYQEMLDSQHDRRKIVIASEVMSSPVITTFSHLSLLDTWTKMEQSKIHHLPVLGGDGSLIGLVTAHDLLGRSIVNSQGEIEEIKDERVGEVMAQQVVTTSPTTDIRRLAEVMSEYRLGCVPIVSETKALVGIVTLSDLVKRLSSDPPLAIYA